jgi:hypothetical protein
MTSIIMNSGFIPSYSFRLHAVWASVTMAHETEVPRWLAVADAAS